MFFELNVEDEYLLEYVQKLVNNINEHYNTESEKSEQTAIEEAKYIGVSRTTLTDLINNDSVKFGTASKKDRDCMNNSYGALHNDILNVLKRNVSLKKSQSLIVFERSTNLELKNITNIYIVERLLEYFDDIGINKNTIWNLEPSHTIKALSDRISILEEKINAIL